ncbi:hypothetical protein GALMADRAFT_253138 [Galerina marginata CBS 339.88]|uniref:Chitin-binding type-4 domain-containing protein n=1 Tax=Galerina marginata (strain CBS 339.88) TaxID=685588 RepID=A0A067SN17_GALM3|nr:hypothetical protein GALMADRAFT_253138 [Galerina marginata CBS 339.88]
MINIFTLSSLALAMLHMAVTSVSAHGFVSEPPSRQARCRDGQVPGCGPVQWEPQSVEALQGSFLCNGGGNFPELNVEALWAPHFFTVPPGIDSLSFTWTLPAPHRTTTWEYFMLTQNNALLTSFNDFNATPPSTVVHSVPMNGFTGRQTVLARWNIGDTPNAFYSCVDLLLNPTQTGIPAGAAATQVPIAMPLGVPGTEANAMNSSGSANTVPSANKPLQNLLFIQGPSS